MSDYFSIIKVECDDCSMYVKGEDIEECYECSALICKYCTVHDPNANLLCEECYETTYGSSEDE